MKGEEKKEDKSLSFKEMQLLVKLMAKAKGSAYTNLISPRYGGLNKTGPWTGSGTRGLFSAPKNISCYRGFNIEDPIKSEIKIGAIQQKCELGVQEEANLFRTSHELNS